MILVTLGTHEQPFERALDFVSELEHRREDVLVQHGATPPRRELVACEMGCVSRLGRARRDDADRATLSSPMRAWVDGHRDEGREEADHDPRLVRFGEHVDDHQVQLADRLWSATPRSSAARDSDLEELVAQARESAPATLGTRSRGFSVRSSWRCRRLAPRPSAARRHRAPVSQGRMRVALLLSTLYFEDFYGASLGLTRARYLETATATTGRGTGAGCSRRKVSTRYLHPEHRARRACETRPMATPCGFFPRAGWPGRGCGSRCSSAPRSAVTSVRPPMPARFWRRCGRPWRPTDRTCLCVQEYWTARFDVIVRALRPSRWSRSTRALPDRHEIKLLKRGLVPSLRRDRRPDRARGGKGRSLRRAGGADPQRGGYRLFSPGRPREH